MEGVPVVPPEPSLSGSALGLWGQHPVQDAQYKTVAISSLRDSLQSSHPHRLQTVMLPSKMLNASLSFNIQISHPAASSATTNSACPSAAFLIPQQKPLMLSAGITKVAHLRLSLQPQLLAGEMSSVLLALPPA